MFIVVLIGLSDFIFKFIVKYIVSLLKLSFIVYFDFACNFINFSTFFLNKILKFHFMLFILPFNVVFLWFLTLIRLILLCWSLIYIYNLILIHNLRETEFIWFFKSYFFVFYKLRHHLKYKKNYLQRLILINRIFR